MTGSGRQGTESEVGSLLRQTRIALGHSIPEVARIVRIRQAFIAAIEGGRFEQLPGGAYTIGFIRTYSEYLGLEANEVVRRFKLETGAKAPAAKLNFPSPLGESGVPKGAILLIGAVIALIGYGIWYVSSSRYLDVAELTLPVPEHLRQMLPGQGADSTSTAQRRPEGTPLPKVEVAIETPAEPREPAAVPAPVPVPGTVTPPGSNSTPAPAMAMASPSPVTSPAVSPQPVTPQPASPPNAMTIHAPSSPPSSSPAAVAAAPAPATPALPVQTTPGGGAGAASGRVVLLATTDTWVEIRDPASRAVVFSRLMRPGDTFAVPDRPGLLLRTGNAGGLEAAIDGAPGRALGKTGTVRRNVVLDADALRAELSTLE
ncbi:MAG: DUF4115 domain-containing protein [Rhodospirillales bacterium]